MRQVKPTLAQPAPNPMFRLADLARDRAEVIHLEFGEPGLPTPAHIAAAAVASIRDERQGYGPTNGPDWLRAAIAARIARVDAHHPTPEQVVVTAGGTGALLATLLCLCGVDDDVLVPDPGWPGYDGILAAAGARPVRYPLLPATDWLPDLAALDALVTPRTRVLLVNSPSNPGGAVFPPATIAALVDCARRHDLWLLSDECYDELIYAGAHVSPATLDDDGRVIAIGTCSKSYAMTGYRVGWTVAPAGLASALGIVAGAQANNLPLSMLRAAHAALTGPQACVATMRDTYRANRDLALDLLRAAGFAADAPAGAFYLLVDVARAANRPAASFDSLAFAEALLAARAIAVAPGGAFGATIPGHVRISLAGDPAALRTGLMGLLDFARAWE
jgi:aspartate aminotransferase/aminotransferase